MAEWGFEAGNSLVQRYVHSLYGVAQKAGREKMVAKELATIKDMIVVRKDHEKLLKRVSLLHDEGASFVRFLEKELKLSVEVRNFLNLLLQNRRLEMVVEICGAYAVYRDKLDGKKLFYLTLAKEQTKTSINGLIKNLKSVFGTKIECVTRIDPAIKDGFKLQYQSRVLDYSLKSKLRRLRTAIRRES